MSTAGIFRGYRSSPAERADRSAGDRQRHRAKVRESIRENIADIISEEPIIGKSKDKVIKVPLRGIKEYRFIYGENAPGVGTGDGEARPGQVVGKTGKEGQGKGDGQAGDRPGVDYYETDVTLEELVEIMFEDLELPNLERTTLREIPTDRSAKRKGYRHKGIRPRLDKRRTARNRVVRLMASGASIIKDMKDGVSEDEYLNLPEALRSRFLRDEHDGKYYPHFSFHKDDLRYKHLETDTREDSNAVVICIMDTSGSMDTMKKYLARSFFFLLYQFITTKYRQAELVFIGHHTEASEVTEEDFFKKGESGGTFISSGYQKALDVIAERYHPSLWNIYAFHCSDGDNFDSDNPAALRTAKELCDVCNLFGYGEIKPLGSRYYESSMLNVFKSLLDMKNFQTLLIERKEDVWPSFKAFLEKDRVKD